MIASGAYPVQPARHTLPGVMHTMLSTVEHRARLWLYASMTADVTSVGTARPVLDVAIDFGATPSLATVITQLDALAGVWSYCLHLESAKALEEIRPRSSTR